MRLSGLLLPGFLVSLLMIASAFKHPVYISVTDLKFNSSESRFQGYVKIFTNDLEDAIRKKDKKSPDILNNKDKAFITARISDYLVRCLHFYINKKVLDFQVIGYENEQEATWIYIQTDTCVAPRVLSLHNRILYDLLPGQMNIVHVEIGDDRQSSKVNYPDHEISFNY